MVWVAVVLIVVILGVGLALFYRRAQQVDSEVADAEGHPTTPLFAGVQRRIRRNSEGGMSWYVRNRRASSIVPGAVGGAGGD